MGRYEEYHLTDPALWVKVRMIGSMLLCAYLLGGSGPRIEEA